MRLKIMSRVLVGFGETIDFRGRGQREMDMDFLNVCHTRAPKGQKVFYYFSREDVDVRLGDPLGFENDDKNMF